jgi:hypothetical protein
VSSRECPDCPQSNTGPRLQACIFREAPTDLVESETVIDTGSDSIAAVAPTSPTDALPLSIGHQLGISF